MLRSLAVGLAGVLLAGTAIAQISGDVVRIGILTDMSASSADSTGPGSVEVARMAAAEVNNTVAGKRIEIVSGDHQQKPDVGASIARRWFDAEGVDVIADLPHSGVALAVQELAKNANKVALISSAGTSLLSGKNCSPNGVHWTFDTYALSRGTAAAVLRQGAKSWAFLTADYAFGHALEKDAAEYVSQNGGRVLASVKHPFNASDFASFLLQLQGTKAEVIGLATAVGDLVNAVKQASEFGIQAGGQKLAALLMLDSDVHAIGLQATQGTYLTTPFYWDMNDETRAFSAKFREKFGRPPSFLQAGVYGQVRHYLKAVQAAGTDDGRTVVAKMKEIPVDDMFTKGARIRDDGRVFRDMYLAQVKSPAESKGPWDYFKIVATIPAADVTLPLEKSECPLVKK
ncbi:MAG: ABC transporter substrate-binding protein [Alphaproteobacteria bacterium]|nr:ABC transporter substrate-binding protein [Alphaproteobacteria bacterium]